MNPFLPHGHSGYDRHRRGGPWFSSVRWGGRKRRRPTLSATEEPTIPPPRTEKSAPLLRTRHTRLYHQLEEAQHEVTRGIRPLAFRCDVEPILKQYHSLLSTPLPWKTQHTDVDPASTLPNVNRDDTMRQLWRSLLQATEHHAPHMQLPCPIAAFATAAPAANHHHHQRCTSCTAPIGAEAAMNGTCEVCNTDRVAPLLRCSDTAQPSVGMSERSWGRYSTRTA